jgi:hypothetical protein
MLLCSAYVFLAPEILMRDQHIPFRRSTKNHRFYGKIGCHDGVFEMIQEAAPLKFESIRKNAKPALKTLIKDVADFVQWPLKREANDFAAEDFQIVKDLRHNGYAVIENFWPAQRAFQVRDQLESVLKEGKSCNFDNGSYLRFWDGKGYDDGVRRLYHLDKMFPEFVEYRFNPRILRIASEYYRHPFYSGVLTFQHNVQTNRNTRRYHVDAFSKEFKSFLYLDNVTIDNGPFTYIRGSNRSRWIRLKKHLTGNVNDAATSFYDEDLKNCIHNEVKICAKAGTMILADVRGIHRGSPQVEGCRSVIVNYLYPEPGDLQLDY